MGWEDKVIEKSRKPVKARLHERTFKENFITTFVATWCANEYSDACMRAEHNKLSNPPIEDAEFLANEVWEKIVKHELSL